MGEVIPILKKIVLKSNLFQGGRMRFVGRARRIVRRSGGRRRRRRRGEEKERG